MEAKCTVLHYTDSIYWFTSKQSSVIVKPTVKDIIVLFGRNYLPKTQKVTL